MIKAGDMFKNIESGIIFIVKSVDPRAIILGIKDGFQSMFVNPINCLSGDIRRCHIEIYSQKSIIARF